MKIYHGFHFLVTGMLLFVVAYHFDFFGAPSKTLMTDEELLYRANIKILIDSNKQLKKRLVRIEQGQNLSVDSGAVDDIAVFKLRLKEQEKKIAALNIQVSGLLDTDPVLVQGELARVREEEQFAQAQDRTEQQFEDIEREISYEDVDAAWEARMNDSFQDIVSRFREFNLGDPKVIKQECGSTRCFFEIEHGLVDSRAISSLIHAQGAALVYKNEILGDKQKTTAVFSKIDYIQKLQDRHKTN